ncbi:MAG: F0F1 ATP synthase subunit alpha [Gammaproteobacteria bacterium]
MTLEIADSDGPIARQRRWVDAYRFGVRLQERGSLVSVGDGIAWVAGLPSAAIDDVLVFDDGSRGMVFDLNPDSVGVVLLQTTDRLTAGTPARVGNRALTIPVGDALLGRVVDPLGVALDGGTPVPVSKLARLNRPAPPISARELVHEPMYTGTLIVDALIPIGRGQRQLVIGDEGLGRTAIALDAVINQRGRDVLCVYVLIGQKRTAVINTVATLRERGALDYTAVVVAEASALPGLQFLAPFAGCAVAEHWLDQGRHVLVVYDDLSTHARTYRELSLLLKRPPGREAYPGDLFSVHARLLERSTCLSAAHGGGSMTALPIVETHQGEIAAYVPTNLISITDGQIYLDAGLFSAGFRPAIDIARSVSRIGGAAQHPRIRVEAARMKLDYLRFLDLEVFTRFGARLEASLEEALVRGRVLRELLKQDRLAPLPVQSQLALLIAYNERLLDGVPPADVRALAQRLAALAGAGGPGLEQPRETWAAAIAAHLAPGA